MIELSKIRIKRSGDDRSNDPCQAEPKASSVDDEASVEPEDVYVPPPAYVPKAPYPTIPKQKIKEQEYEKLKNLVEELHVRLSFVEDVKMVPSVKRYIKVISTDKLSLERGVLMLTEECSAVLQNIMPEKREDPGPFLLPCHIGSLAFVRSLCDLVQELVGVLENIHVGVGKGMCLLHTLTDFVVLKLEEEPKDPLILEKHVAFLSLEESSSDKTATASSPQSDWSELKA
ncbi:hypothetical protein N665_0098s0072 [Sinapis alba]|nr:hypothetical protein N665_0098s0072 [Sinapis alba]